MICVLVTPATDTGFGGICCPWAWSGPTARLSNNASKEILFELFIVFIPVKSSACLLADRDLTRATGTGDDCPPALPEA
ncbi:hypothetical protein MnTg04_01298 [bacterium MnTg04]|nr:hypothetical protein MnTg04_01298 [bacterium MnTg04]